MAAKKLTLADRLAARQRDFAGVRPALIACLGDSVTHGCFGIYEDRNGGIGTDCVPDDAYPARLQRELSALYPYAAPTVLNAGVSGDNAPGGLKRLERDALCAKPDLVVVNFALNDSMSGDAGLARYAEAMRALFERVLAAGSEAVLLTPNHMCAYVDPALDVPRFREIAAQAAEVQSGGVLARYVEAARAVADALDVPVADACARWDALAARGVDTTALLANHINHPSAAMHRAFVEALMGVIFA